MGHIVGTVESTCAGKETFLSFALASTIVKRKSKRGQNIRAYRCPFCSGWHIGRRPRTAHQFHKSKMGQQA